MSVQPVTFQSIHTLYSKPTVTILIYLLLISVLMVGCSQSTTTLRRTPFPRSLTQHIVVKGDTLYSIAYRARVDVKELIRWNHLAKPYTLFPGQTIKLRPKTITFKATSQRRKNRPGSHARKALRAHNTNKKNTSIAEKANKSLKILWRWPLTGVVVKSFNQTGRKGIDIAGKLGDTILAAASGKVVYSGPGLLGYGNLIIIKHDTHYLTAYANNRRLFVKEGQTVRQSQQIAEVGALSGKKPSLHFEIRHEGKPVNPLLYLPKR